MAEVGKLYLTKTISLNNIGQTSRIELNGTVSLTVYGSEDEQANVAAMTPVSEALTADFYYPFDTLPKYIAFIGTADRINVSGYSLEYVKDIS